MNNGYFKIQTHSKPPIKPEKFYYVNLFLYIDIYDSEFNRQALINRFFKHFFKPTTKKQKR